MYIIKNAFRNIMRTKGRNILIGSIIAVIACASCIGLSIMDATEKAKKNNLTGQVSLVESKVKPKFNITRSYCEKLNNK